MKNFIFTILLLFPLTTFGKSIEVQVSGISCSGCAKKIEKKFIGQKNVESVIVNVEKQLITIETIDDKNLSDRKIKKILKKGKYTVESISR